MAWPGGSYSKVKVPGRADSGQQPGTRRVWPKGQHEGDSRLAPVGFLQPCPPSRKALTPFFPSDPGKAVSTNHRTVELALKPRTAGGQLVTPLQRACCKVSLHDNTRDNEVPQAALRCSTGPLVMLLQTWLEGANAWAVWQMASQILPCSSIIQCI